MCSLQEQAAQSAGGSCRSWSIAATTSSRPTRSPEKLDGLRALGAEPVVMDGLDAASVGEAVATAEPEVVIHQMTALAGMSDLRHFDDGLRAHERAADARHRPPARPRPRPSGVRRFVAQSYTGWPNDARRRPGQDGERSARSRPAGAAAAVDRGDPRISSGSCSAAPIEGVVLRYGEPLRPRARRWRTSTPTWSGRASSRSSATAPASGRSSTSTTPLAATVAAVEGEPRASTTSSTTSPRPSPSGCPYLAECLGARPPRHVPAWLARLAIGEVGVSMMTQIRGASNAKARRELGWEPRWRAGATGFVSGLDDDRRCVPAA